MMFSITNSPLRDRILLLCTRRMRLVNSIFLEGRNWCEIAIALKPSSHSSNGTHFFRYVHLFVEREEGGYKSGVGLPAPKPKMSTDYCLNA